MEIPEFAPQEISLLNDTTFLTAKRKITRTLILHFEILEKSLQPMVLSEWQNLEPAHNKSSGKISKGENYKGLPYIVLDYPAIFSRTDIFAFRTLFWWGNYYSNQFILMGAYLEKFREKLDRAYNRLKDDEVYIDLSSNPWNHDVSDQHFVTLSRLGQAGFQQYVKERTFVKLVWTLDLSSWKTLIQFSSHNLKTMVNILN